MLRDCNFAIKDSASGDVFQQLWPTNQQITGQTTGIKYLDEEFEKPWVFHEQLKKHAPQAIGFDEPNKLVENSVGITRLRQPFKQEGSQIAQDLPCPRCDMKTTGSFR